MDGVDGAVDGGWRWGMEMEIGDGDGNRGNKGMLSTPPSYHPRPGIYFS